LKSTISSFLFSKLPECFDLLSGTHQPFSVRLLTAALGALLGMLDLAQYRVEDGVVVGGTGNSSTAC